MIKNLIVILAMFAVLLPNFIFAQEEPSSPPETIEEVKEWGKRALEITKKDLPGILAQIWKEEVLSVWQRMWNWTTGIWDRIWDWLSNWWRNTLWPWLKGEVKAPLEEGIEKRKEIVEEKIEEEKEKLIDRIVPETVKSFWQKFKNLIE